MNIATAGIIRRDGKVFLARRAQGQRLAGKWEFPGGKLDDGESKEECLARELEEEFAIQVRVGRFLGSTKHKYAFAEIELWAYEVEHVSGKFAMSVHDAMKWVDPADLPNEDLSPADFGLLGFVH